MWITAQYCPLLMSRGLTAGVTFAGTTLTVDPADAAFQSLAVGVTQIISISYDSRRRRWRHCAANRNHHHLRAPMMLPWFGTSLTVAVNEDDAISIVDLLAGASDVDIGDVLSIQNFTASGGSPLGLTPNGTDLNIDPSHPDYQSLALARRPRHIVGL